MHKLIPRRTETHGRLSHKLMHPHPILVWIWPLISKLLNGSLAGSFHTIINIITKRTCEASGRTSLNNLKPVVVRMRWPRCNEQASWLIRLSVIHVTQYARSAVLPLYARHPNRGTCRVSSEASSSPADTRARTLQAKPHRYA
jgi:hypothetical protein